jgi:ankyrin repeat protein
MVENLINAGANIDEKNNDGDTSLIMASRCG